jgi:hypothetical protein
MTVQVQQVREKANPLNAVIRGLQAVSGVLNVKSQLEQAEHLSAQREQEAEAQRFAAQDVTKASDIEKGLRAGMIQRAEPGMKGAITRRVEAAGPSLDGAIPFTEERFITKEELQRQEKIKKENERFIAQEEKETARFNQKLADNAAKRFDANTKEDKKAVKKVRQVADLYNKDDVTSADDISVINLWARILSPGIVTDTDFNRALQSGGKFEQLKGWFDKIEGQGFLTPEQRAEVLQAVRAASASHIDNLNAEVRDAKQLAERKGFDFRDVVGEEVLDNFQATDNIFAEALGRMRPQGQGQARPGQALSAPAAAPAVSPEVQQKINERNEIQRMLQQKAQQRKGEQLKQPGFIGSM